MTALAGALTGASAQAVWTTRSPLPKMKILQGVLWTGDKVVAVGDSGTIATSPNGANWSFASTATASSIYSAAAGGGTLVAVGAGGLVRSSADGGATWTARTSGVTANLLSVTWTGAAFIAVGSGGAVVTSLDGVTWTQRTSGVTGILRSVAWTGSLAVAVGDGGLLITSPDGATWTARSSGTSAAMYGVHWGGGQLVAVGNGGLVRTSPDGLDWTPRTSGVTVYLNSVTWTGSFYAAVGDAGTVITSPDGITWTTRTSGTSQVLRAVTWTATRLMAVGNAGIVRTSVDGIAWGSPGVTSAGLYGVALASGKPRVIVGDGGIAVVATGDTGWSTRATGTTSGLYAVAWGNNLVVAVGAGGAVATSPDGDAWTVRSSGTTDLLNTVASRPTQNPDQIQFVAAGANGTIRTSLNGVDWSSSASGVTTLIYSVTWCGNQFVAVGAAGSALTSSNGTAWANRTSGTNTTQPLRAVTCAGDQIVAVGSAGTILTSPDGAAWTARTSGVTGALNGVAYSGGVLLAVGSGTILTSTDGITWNPQAPGTDATLYGAAGNGASWIVAGAGGTILTSPQVELPGAPSLSTPANLAVGVSVFGPLSWTAASGATHYRLQVATDSNFVGMIFNDTVSGLSRNLPALASNTLHYWRVRGLNSLGGGPFSPTRRFTTGTAPSGPPPAPALVSPALFQTGVNIPATLTWNVANGASAYHIQISTVSNFTSGILLDDSTVTATTRTFAGLGGGANYYWRVRARNGFGSGDWSEVWAFTTVLQAPSAPALLAPAAFAENVSRATSVTWAALTGSVTYHAQVALDPGFTQIVARDSALSETHFRPGSLLAANTVHYWRVRAKNGAGAGDWSAIRQFTTGTSTSLLPGGALARFSRMGEARVIQFQLAAPERILVRMRDLGGRKVTTLVDGIRGPGVHAIELPRGLEGSVYILDIRLGSKREWLKIHP